MTLLETSTYKVFKITGDFHFNLILFNPVIHCSGRLLEHAVVFNSRISIQTLAHFLKLLVQVLDLQIQYQKKDKLLSLLVAKSLQKL